MSAVVMKFGGTSVADDCAIRRLCAIVAAERARGGSPVVVVSAMSGVTDGLLALARSAAAGDSAGVDRDVREIERRHLDAATALVDERAGAVRERPLHSDAAAALHDVFAAQFAELRAALTAVSSSGEASPPSLDRIAATGELLSSRLVAAALAAQAVDSAWVDARRTVVTNDAFTCAAPLAAPTCDAVARGILPLLAIGTVPVLGGYIGATPDGRTTTLGRGGSDYSAALIAAALHDAARSGISTLHVPITNQPITNQPIDNRHVDNQQSAIDNKQSAICNLQSAMNVAIEIWTDVDGMLTADPRVVEAPRLVPFLSFGEASELAYFGAKVLHPSTITPAVERDIPVRILNSRRPDAPGTLISSRPAADARPIAAIACKRNITVIEVTSTRMLMAHGFLRRLFEVFERCRTAVDVVTTSEVSVSITVDDDRHLDAIVTDLRQFADVLVDRDMAILCAVGDGLRADPTLAVRVLGALDGLPLRMVSQAASRRNLTVVLHERDVADAMARLHRAWFGESERLLAPSSATA